MEPTPLLLVCGRSEPHLGALGRVEGVRVVDRGAPHEADVLVVLPDVAAPVALVQRAVTGGGQPEAVLVVAPEEVEALRARLTITPYVGVSTAIVGADDLAGFDEAVEDAIARARARVRHGADLRALGARLDLTPPATTPPDAALEVQRRLVAALIREAPDAIVVVGSDERIVLWNATAEALFGLTAEVATGQDVDILFPDEAADALARARARWREEGPRTPIEARLRLAGGEVGVVELRPLALHGAAGAFIGGALLVRDIREEKAHEAVRSRFISVLGHDLRTPLQSVRMGVQLLERMGIDDRGRPVLERMDRSVDRMQRMIDDLLDLARSERPGGMPIERAPFDLDELVRGGVDELGAAHPDRTLISELGAVGTVAWDPDRIAQVLANLVSNALTHGDPQGTVTVRTRRDGDAAVIEVHNVGPPIPPDELDTLFELYARASGASGGLGLGLHISREIVRAHGGTIGATSDAASGTTFHVRIPRGPTG